MKDVIAEARSKCLGCKNKVSFKVVDGVLQHFDLFATYEAASIGPCKCPEVIGELYDGVDDRQNPQWKDEAAFDLYYYKDAVVEIPAPPVVHGVEVQKGQLWESPFGTLYRIKEVRFEVDPDIGQEWIILANAVSQYVASGETFCDPSNFKLNADSFEEAVTQCLTQYNWNQGLPTPKQAN